MTAAHDPTTESAEVIERVGHARNDVAAQARRRLDGGDEATSSFREEIKGGGLSWYPMVALSALVIVDEFQGTALAIMGPDIASALGLSVTTLTVLIGLKTLVVAIGALLMASYVQKRPRRALVAVVTAIVWTVFTLATSFVISVWGLLLVLLVDGASTGSTRSVHTPLLLDNYPRRVRLRALSVYQGADSIGKVLAPLTIALLTFAFDATWRGVFLGLAGISAIMTLVSLRLRDPGFGAYDEAVIAETLREHDGDVGTDDEADTDLGFFEIVKRVMVIPTVRRLLIVFAVLGIFLVPLMTLLSFFLEERFNLDATERALVFSVAFAGSIAGLAIVGRRFEQTFKDDPQRMMSLVSKIMAVAMFGLISGAAMPTLWLVVPVLAIGVALTILMLPPLYLAVHSVVPSRMRPHVAALLQIYLAGIGGLAGAIFLGSIESRFGVQAALLGMLLPASIAALVMRSTSKTIVADMDALVLAQIEEQEFAALRRSGTVLPMLACRGVDVAYGQLQVLFGVDFTVDAGEMVALLGTNGAGKSTLLRAISGLSLPDRGSIRYQGNDITYLGAERRVELGIAQVPGGRAVFGPLSVAENLRLYGYALRHQRGEVDAAIDRCFEAFPRLQERRNQMAQTLSGGEQQMLALSKALILQPRLLLIDELSLGLAPIIVGQLMDMVREINNEGTAVVLVEQSVNVALELVQHAYFMEKGQIRFDGPADKLRSRDDLLRAVFLEGADAHAEGAN
jgi:ABC-type branched-subunit amino acid transport system ATPase component/sugar phosphate permease